MSSMPTVALAYWILLCTTGGGPSTEGKAACDRCGKACVEVTAWVPTWTTETQTCTETHYRTEERTRVCTVYHKVPVVKEGVIKTRVYVPKTIETERQIEVAKPVSKIVDQTYTIQVPVKDTVTKTRMVRMCVPVTETRTVCDEEGKKEVTETCYKNVCVEQTYECEVDACAEVEQTRQARVWETKKEMQTVVDRRCTLVPEIRTKTVPVTICELVPEERVETYTECVPYEVEREVEVCVCRMVPQRIVLPCGCCK